jgi:hypothetical protein
MTQLIAGYSFHGPYFDARFLPLSSGVYVITDSRMQVLDVGESENLADRVANHDRSSCWARNASGPIGAWVLSMPGSSTDSRRSVERAVRFQTSPTCGAR